MLTDRNIAKNDKNYEKTGIGWAAKISKFLGFSGGMWGLCIYHMNEMWSWWHHELITNVKLYANITH